MTTVPAARRRRLNTAPVRPSGDFVLYWMVACRRTIWSFGLQHAAELARQLGRPLLVLEALRCDYPWASDRLHRFVLDGMVDNAWRLTTHGVGYYPYVEPERGAGKGLVAALGGRACVVVTDAFPAFVVPRMVAAAAQQLPVALDEVDSNGLLPLRAADRAFPTAFAFRRFLQAHLGPHLAAFPQPDPLAEGTLPQPVPIAPEIAHRWPPARAALLMGDPAALAALPIDHTVGAVARRGGALAAQAVLQRFLDERLPRYLTEHNQPEAEATSELSPYLHFGQIAAHQVVAALLQREEWSPDQLAPRAVGRRSGWWGLSPAAEAFLDELVTWRELGFNTCAWRPDDYADYASLPGWARATLAAHASDPRPYRYTPDELRDGGTHDPLWNASQRQLVREGRIPNYLRMLWGKKILEWSPAPEAALATMIELNNRFALDGRDPNSYSGISWVLGRYDRPWGPERPIFGTVRWMSSENTARKIAVQDYLRRYGP